jgi:circadian clock protein KaiB
MDRSGIAGKAFEQASGQRHDERYVLRLYVTGATPRSKLAIANTRAICEEYLYDHYELEVIDLYQQPAALRDAQVIVAPTLVKLFPLPLKRLLGDMSDLARVLHGLGLDAAAPESGAPA